MKTLGDRARARRIELKLSQAAVAKHCGVSQQAIALMEKTGSVPDYIDLLAEVLHTTTSWLRTGNDESAARADAVSQMINRLAKYNNLIEAYERLDPIRKQIVDQILFPAADGAETSNDERQQAKTTDVRR